MTVVKAHVFCSEIDGLWENPEASCLAVLTDEHAQQNVESTCLLLGSTWHGPSGEVHLVNVMPPLPTASRAWQRHCRARHMQPCSRNPGTRCYHLRENLQLPSWWACGPPSASAFCTKHWLTQSTRGLSKDVATHLSSCGIFYMSEFFFCLDFSSLGGSFLPSFLPHLGGQLC